MLSSWAGMNLVSTVSFLVAARLFKRYGTENNAAKWLLIYLYLVVFQYLAWGLIGPMSFMIDSELYHLLTLFMLGGIAAGGIVTRGLLFKIYVIGLSTLLMPTIITLALRHPVVAEGMLAILLLYMIFMLPIAKSYSASINRNLLLWLHNEKLLEQLRRSNSEVEETNRILTLEIEQRKNIESELVEAKERSERANEAKNQFLATVSHELRTPLNGIIGFSNLLQDEKEETQRLHHVDQVGKAAQTLLRIVNDILDISAIEAGHVNFHKEPFSLRGEIEDLLAILRPMAEQKNLALQLNVSDDVEDALCGDASRLRQIISNLLSNALKYTEAGRVDLNVSHLKAQDGKVVLRFAIEDTGIGIAADALASIFDNFTRVENFDTRRNEGVGLGLPIAKNLVQKMNGNLHVHSVPGKGSCFSFELSFEQCDEMRVPARDVQASGLAPEQWRGFNVLVVDDNMVNRMVLASFLTKIGIPFSEAINGYEALERIRRGNYDMVLLDIQMPDISGIDVAARLRKELDSMPVLIAVTAHAFPHQRQAILGAGFSDLLTKPVKIGDLLRALTKGYMNTRRLPA